MLKERRVALGLTQAEAAARAGMRVRSLQRFEQSGHIGLDKLMRLLVVYRMEQRIALAFEDRSWWSLEELRRAERRSRAR